MTIFEKIDTERHRRDIYLCKPLSRPDATSFLVTQPDAIPNPSVSLGHPPEEPTRLNRDADGQFSPPHCQVCFGDRFSLCSWGTLPM